MDVEVIVETPQGSRNKYKIDPKRIYLTGLSMGGAGTWSLAAAHPERWAAIVPICFGGDPSTAARCFSATSGRVGPLSRRTERSELRPTINRSPNRLAHCR